MKLQIRVDDNGIISDVKFKTFGCGSAIASSSFMTERVKGLSLEEAGKIKNTEIAKELCLPPVKLHCSSASPILGCNEYVLMGLFGLQCWLKMLFAPLFGIIAPSGRSSPTRSKQPSASHYQLERLPLPRYKQNHSHKTITEWTSFSCSSLFCSLHLCLISSSCVHIFLSMHFTCVATYRFIPSIKIVAKHDFFFKKKRYFHIKHHSPPRLLSYQQMRMYHRQTIVH